MQPDSFIVRPSSSGGEKNPFSVTVYHLKSSSNLYQKKSVAFINFHVRRRVVDKRFATGIYSENEKTFATLKELVEFYQTHTLVVGENNRIRLDSTPLRIG